MMLEEQMLTELKQELDDWRDEVHYLQKVIWNNNQNIASRQQTVQDTQYQLDYAQQQVREYTVKVSEMKELVKKNTGESQEVI